MLVQVPVCGAYREARHPQHEAAARSRPLLGLALSMLALGGARPVTGAAPVAARVDQPTFLCFSMVGGPVDTDRTTNWAFDGWWNITASAVEDNGWNDDYRFDIAVNHDAVHAGEANPGPTFRDSVHTNADGAETGWTQWARVVARRPYDHFGTETHHRDLYLEDHSEYIDGWDDSIHAYYYVLVAVHGGAEELDRVRRFWSRIEQDFPGGLAQGSAILLARTDTGQIPGLGIVISGVSVGQMVDAGIFYDDRDPNTPDLRVLDLGPVGNWFDLDGRGAGYATPQARLSPEALQWLQAGHLYVSVTGRFPGNELRGSLRGIPEACDGDLNLDGHVDEGDLGILLADWGCPNGTCTGDLDADGDVDETDLATLLADWGCDRR